MLFGVLPSPFFIFDIVLMFLVVQQIEGNLITPALVGKSVGLHPMLVMISLLIGGTILGPLGMLFAVPATGVLKVILKRNYLYQKKCTPLVTIYSSSILNNLNFVNVK